MVLVDVVRRTLQREQLASRSTRVLVALSGGPDSMALLHVLHALHGQARLRLTGVLHLNHQLRDEADDDERFCANVSHSLGLPFIADRADVRAFAHAEKRSLEDAAHVLRYAFFTRMVAHASADVVAVAHTRDDQAETVLLRLLRGAGARGLSGMHPRSGVVIRPLLDASRRDVMQFLRVRHLSYLHDHTNLDISIPRNRVRSELLPLMAERFNPRIADVLAGEADLARADEECLAALTGEWCAAHLKPLDRGRFAVDADALLAAPRAVAWRALLRGMTAASGGRFVAAAHVRRAWEVATGGIDQFDAPGHTVQRDKNFVVLTGRAAGSVGRPAPSAPGAPPGFRENLPVPGAVVMPGSGVVIAAELGFAGENRTAGDRCMAIVPKEKVAGGLAVRTRRPGDRLEPSGAGHRKLQDLLVDRKVPRTERDGIPIVVDARDRIVWVAGYALDWNFRVSDPAQAVVILRLKGVGGSF